MGSWWDAHSQWYMGWHQPGSTGLAGLRGWSWPSNDWSLIGLERWEYRRRGDVLREAFYNYPNPSTLQVAPPPTGHYHVKFHGNGEVRSSQWIPEPLQEPELYLKGGRTGLKGTGMAEAKGKDNFQEQQQGKGKDDAKGKGRAKGKGKGSGKVGKGI